MREQGANVAGRYSKYAGYSRNLGITRFQDLLFAVNDLPDRRRTDEELSHEMREEYPRGKPIPADYRDPRSVRTIRRRYNIGSQHHGPAAKQSRPY